jgi:hypothetical protein
MTSVSDLIGFFVISVLPHHPKSGVLRKPLRRHKSDDALINSEDDSPDTTASEDDGLIVPRIRRDRSVTPPGVVYPAKPVSHVPRPALGNPDFWIIAFIMSMRDVFPHILANMGSCRLWLDVYQCSPPQPTSSSLSISNS